MSKLLIYIGEGMKFDLDETVRTINAIDGVSESKLGDFIGAAFECLFASGEVVVRISKDHETITTDGSARESMNFIWQLQNRLSFSIWVIDMNYSFNLEVSKFVSVYDLLSAMGAT